MRQSQFGFNKLPWYRRVLCFLRFHSGMWQYEKNTTCIQLRVCVLCGKPQTRVRHAWESEWRGNGELRSCTRCGKTVNRADQTSIDDLRDNLKALGIEAIVSQRRFWNEVGVIGEIDIQRSPICRVEVLMERDYEGVT